MELHAEGGLDYNQKCFISNSACYEDAQSVAAAWWRKNFPSFNGEGHDQQRRHRRRARSIPALERSRSFFGATPAKSRINGTDRETNSRASDGAGVFLFLNSPIDKFLIIPYNSLYWSMKEWLLC
jgi:hypothetical protein